jgi:SOS-response transcriptional repressor LexA
MLTGEKLGEAISLAIEKKGISKKYLAEMFGVKPPSIQDWIKRGTISKDKLFKLIDYFSDVCNNSHWGIYDNSAFAKSTSNTSPAPDIKGSVPLISWVQAGSWHEVVDFADRSDDIPYLPCPKNHGVHSYALRVRGDSMTAPYGKTYPEGCIIFVDPQILIPSSGDRIIAKIAGESEVTFKVFMQEGDKIWLKPLNPQHPIITDKFIVIGKVIGKWEDD